MGDHIQSQGHHLDHHHTVLKELSTSLNHASSPTLPKAPGGMILRVTIVICDGLHRDKCKSWNSEFDLEWLLTFFFLPSFSSWVVRLPGLACSLRGFASSSSGEAASIHKLLEKAARRHAAEERLVA